MNFWFIINDQQVGPVSFFQTASMGITPDTPAWHEGMADWDLAGNIPALRQLFSGEPIVMDPAPGQETPDAMGEGTFTPPVDDETAEVEVSETAETAGCGAEVTETAEETAQPEAREPQEPADPQQPYGGQPYGAPYQAQQQWGQPQWGQPQQQWGAMPMQGPAPQTEAEKCPSSFIGWNIAALILCCFPIAIIGIIFGAQVSSAWARGDREKARKMSERAEWCVILSISLGLLSMPLQMVLSMFSAI